MGEESDGVSTARAQRLRARAAGGRAWREGSAGTTGMVED